MWRESQLQVGCTNTKITCKWHMMVLDFTQLLHGLRYHRSWRRSASVLNFGWFWHVDVDFLRFFWPLCSSQTLIKARFAAKVASSLNPGGWVVHFMLFRSSTPCARKWARLVQGCIFWLTRSLYKRPSKKVLTSRKLAKNPFDVGEYLSIPHIEIYQRVFANPMIYHNIIPHSAVMSWVLRMGSAWYCSSGFARAESRGSSGFGPSECPGCGHLPIASAAVGGFQLLRRKKRCNLNQTPWIYLHIQSHTHTCIYI